MPTRTARSSALLGTVLGASLALIAGSASASTLTTSLATFQTGVGAATITSTPNPGNFDLSGLILPTTSTVALRDGQSLGLSNAAQVTQPQNGFPYLLSDGFSGELLLPQDASGNQVRSETITLGSGIGALGFEVVPFSSATGAPNFGFAGGPYTLTVALAGGASSTVALPGGNDNTGTTAPAFFGFFGGGVSSLTITTSDPNGFAFGNFVDVPVPEPASAALLLAGVAATLVRSRGRRKIV